MLRVSGYGRTFNPVEHINPLMVLEGGKVSHAVACYQLTRDWSRLYLRVEVGRDPEVNSGSSLVHFVECSGVQFAAGGLLLACFPFLWGGRALRLGGVGVDLHLRGVKGGLRLRCGCEGLQERWGDVHLRLRVGG